ncbi:MAG TPA: dynamin family protein, partial [Methylotenera sp.]|nr:dynamin family protein [Methylotenera sp.]
MSENKLAHQFAVYSEWRKALVDTICDYRSWLNEQELNDSQSDQRIAQLLERLREDKLNVAFVAEFSRGKSELINAIFFAGYGKRLLPSSAGRTTMCPTELLYDKSKPTSIMMLPIETRLSDATTTEYKRYPDEWVVAKFDVDNNDSMVTAFKEVSNTKSVTLEEAEKYGLFDPNSADDALNINKDGTIDVPCWRYAIINFPHPLLEQGLVILDTPGLNAIGTEPELTLNMLPNAHAVLFILGADTGVTKSEIDVWRQYISGTRWKQKGRLAVLNKIDGLWDELKNEKDIQTELTKQIKTSAELLGLETTQIFPVSAQRGLLAKIHNDAALLEKSRILELEKALSDELIPSKKEIVRDNTQNEVEDLISNSNMIVDARLAGIVEQLNELRGLRGKN